jgi:two-component system sensor histidine kinase and response regulator WspE
MNDFDDLSIYDMFRMEAEEQTEQLQAQLLALRHGDANELVLRSLMRGAHSLKGAARIVGLGGAVRLTHAMEERFVAAQEGQTFTSSEVDILLRATDMLRALADVREADAPAWIATQESAITQLVTELSSAAADPEQKPAPAAATEAEAHEGNENASQPEEAATGSGEPRTDQSYAEMNLRITSQRFDRIIALSSDTLVQAQTMVHLQKSMQRSDRRLQKTLRALIEAAAAREDESYKDPATLTDRLANVEKERAILGNLLHHFDRLIHSHELNTERLHREVLHARLRPFGDVIPNLRRLVRDVASEMGKQVRFEVTGERTEVDRDILERLRAPLEHLLRNSLDHGLEQPEERSAALKSAESVIHLQARHENGRLAITLSDDGRGVDTAAVSRRAIDRGLVHPSVASLLSDAEILEFLFLPGFSTRQDVTEISGRGVGLDIVQSTVHESGGSVRIENQLGVGTKFHIVLPVTRSLMRVMRVQLEDEIYAIPLNRLSRVAALTIIREQDGSAVVDAGTKRVFVVPMMDALQSAETQIESGPATIIFLLNEKGLEAEIAFQIDRIVDETTVAVRQLDPRLGRMAAIAAVTLTEHNVPMLIVEPDDILRLALQAKTHSSTTGRGSVLVVDDSGTVRQMLRRTLLRAGYRVSIAEHGAEAWNLLQVDAFDLLVSDVDMPEMNGIELVEHVRGNSRLSPMPIILLSYKGREEDRRRGLEAGADAYVTKGEFQEQAFLQTVTDLIGPAELQEGVS